MTITTNTSIQSVLSKEPIYRGNDIFLYLTFLNDHNERIDISNDDFWLTLAKDKDQRLPNLELKYTAPADAKSESGELLIFIPNSETINLSGSYWFDLRRFVDVNTTTYKSTIEHGKLQIIDQVNKV